MGKSGLLTVIYGPMFSEKSGELIKRCLMAEKYQFKKVLVFKPDIDKRFSDTEIVSRIGLSIKAYNIPCDLNSSKLFDELENGQMYSQTIKNYDIVAFDEVQFFSPEIVSVIHKILLMGKDVICAGLNLSSSGKSLGNIGELVLMADEPIKKHAYCSICGEPAIFTQRICKKGESEVLIGDTETYTPRCRSHFNP